MLFVAKVSKEQQPNKQTAMLTNKKTRTVTDVVFAVILSILVLALLFYAVVASYDKRKANDKPQSETPAKVDSGMEKKTFILPIAYDVQLTSGECYTVDSVLVSFSLPKNIYQEQVQEIREEIFYYAIDAVEDASWESKDLQIFGSNVFDVMAGKLQPYSATMEYISTYTTFTGMDNSLAIIDKR